MIQQIKAPGAPRIDNGALQINDDWPGLFLRGDSSFYIAHCINLALSLLEGQAQTVSEKVAVGQLRWLRDVILDRVVVRRESESPKGQDSD